MIFNPTEFKKQFPLFSRLENHQLVYLDNAATTQKPQCVIDAISHFYIADNGNAGRASHRLARAATEMLAQTRLKAMHFFGANSSAEVVFTSGATEGINMLAYGLRQRFSADDEILLSVAEHHANLVPWQELAKAVDATLVFMSENCSDIADKVTNKTRVIALAAASNTFGHIIDFSVLAAIKKRYPSIVVVLDASQLAAHVVLDVKNWPCDFLVCSAHKFYGPTGVGLLYGREDVLYQLSPYKFGGEMVANVDLYSSDYVCTPERFEAGTSPLAAIAGLNACFDFLAAQNRSAMCDYERMLNESLHQQLMALCTQYPGVSLLTESSHNVGIAILTSNQYSLADIGFWLDEQDIAVRVGSHCAQPLWKSREVTSALRISLAAYNTEDDVSRLLSALRSFLLAATSTTENLYCESSSFVQTDLVSVDEFSVLDWQALLQPQSWQQRYKTLMGWGKAIAPNSALRTDRYLVKGCETSLWLSHSVSADQHYFLIDSDSTVIKGLAALILCRVNGKLAVDIRTIDFEQYFLAMGLQKHISPSRLNSIHALLKAIQAYVY